MSFQGSKLKDSRQKKFLWKVTITNANRG